MRCGRVSPLSLSLLSLFLARTLHGIPLIQRSPDPGDAFSPWESRPFVGVDQAVSLYSIRISGHLGPTTLSAFESMVSQLKGPDTLLTGVLDQSALYGVLAEIEVLGLNLIELRRLDPRRVEGA